MKREGLETTQGKYTVPGSWVLGGSQAEEDGGGSTRLFIRLLERHGVEDGDTLCAL